MIRVTRSLVRRWMASLLHIHDSPRRTAAAFAVGVFFAFSPFIGLHTVLALVVAFVFSLNRVAVILGLCTNLPWFMAPYYTLATVAASEVVGVRLPADLMHQIRAVFDLSLFSRDFWTRLGGVVGPLLWPYTLGSLVGAVALSAAAFALARPLIAAERRYLHAHGHLRRTPPEAR